MAERPDIDHRVLVLMPTGLDAARTCALLAEEGLAGVACPDLDGLCREIAAGAGLVLLTDEAVAADSACYLSSALSGQPPWSDLPVIVLTQQSSDGRQASLRESANMTLVERPVRMRTLLSVIRAALRARRHQYQVRDLLAERQRAEETLRVERERLRITLASIGDAVISTDAEGRVAFMNGVAEILTGWTQAEALGHPLSQAFRIINERTRQQVENPALRALREGAIVGLANHTVLIARDGLERPIDDSAAPIREGGTALGAVLVFRDVSQRKRAEEALARLAAIVESSEDAIVSKTLDGVIRSWNAAAQRLFGYTAEEAVGRSITLIIPPERIDEERAILDQLRRGERLDHFETVRVAKDGRRLDISLTISPIRDNEGVVVGASKIAHDITERKRSQVERDRLADTLRLALAASDQGTWEWDPETDLVTLSERAGEIYGLEPGRSYTREWMRGLLRPEYRDRAREAAARAVSGADYDMEYPVQRLDGRTAWVAARGRGVYDGNAKLIRMLGVAQDVTPRKEAEAALREADRRKDEFLALLAHELRNPLAPLRNGLQVMRLAGADAGAVAQARAMMERQLAHMVRLIDDLLDVSRISRNKMELRRSRVLLADVVSSAVETTRPAVEEAGHQLTISLLPEPVHLDADLTRLAQVFGNLLSNSAKYTPRGGHIRLWVERQEEKVVVSVRDNGIGIPAESLRSIFDMFSQVDRSIERSTGGLGIGLALVKGLVEMHGGTVTAESPGVGKGSTFTVRLPVLAERAESLPEPLPEQGARPAGPRRRILVVDDSRDSAASMAMMLTLTGNEVQTAHDGIEAVEVAEVFRPQAILMDLGMPRLNGYEATRRIRQQPWGRSVIIIALTGWGQEGDKLQSKEAGCNGHLVKPVSLPDLERLLAEAEASR